MSKRLRGGTGREGGALRKGDSKYARERRGGEKLLHVKVRRVPWLLTTMKALIILRALSSPTLSRDFPQTATKYVGFVRARPRPDAA